MPYSFISGNSYDETGLFLSNYWKEKTGEPLYNPFSAVGVINGDKLIGVFIFSEYTGRNIEIHLLGYRILNRKVIKYIANYVFNYLGCDILRVKLKSETQKYIEDYLLRLGFEYEFLLDKYFLEDHALLYKIYRDKAIKWIK